jgi:hypothetical protein
MRRRGLLLCLCEEAKREILRAGRRADYTLEEVNIERDPLLFRRYGWDIPVISFDGLIAFKHRLTAEQFVRQLERALAE